MNPNERPLSGAEREQLRDIRQRRANRNARREIQDDQYFKGAVKNLFLIFAGAAFVFWPWLVWHGTNSQGNYTWDRGTWIATPIWWGFLAVCALLVWRARRRQDQPRQAEADSAAELRWQSAYAAFKKRQEDKDADPQRQRRDGGSPLPLFKPKDSNT
jgi:hypothetical protein